MSKRRKLPNGSGSIEKVEKNSDGKTRVLKYRARLPATYDENGKKYQKDIGFFKTYNEAREALLNYQEPEPVVTFKELFEKYKESNAYKKLTENSKNRYNTSFAFFAPLHNKDIHDIKYTDLQSIIDKVEADGYDKTLRNGEVKHMTYSKSSMERLKHLVSKIYSIAIKNNIVSLDLSKYLEVGGDPIRRKKEIFTSDEIKALGKSIPHNPNARHILILIFTGMRTGEYLNLKRNQINFEKNLIENFGEKTEAGRKRKMFIHPYIKDMLMDLAIESKTGYIIEYEEKPISYDKIFYDRIYYPALEKAGVSRKIPYTCRYTFATIAHQSGVDDKALQKLMGHTNFNITANSYIQDLDEFIYSELVKIKWRYPLVTH